MIYYITRSYYPMKTGGTNIRKHYVKLLKENNFDICVVTVNYDDNGYREDVVDGVSVIYLPAKINLRLGMLLERIGYLEDYLDYWTHSVISYLDGRLTSDDIVFSTTGGELACIKIGSILKRKCKCKFIINLHDPIDYTLVNGLMLDKKFHVSREKNEALYFSNVDIVITSSQIQQQSIINKKIISSMKVINGYFGYDSKYNISNRRNHDGILRIVYGGTFGRLQSPELLAKYVYGRRNIEAYFIGNYKNYKPLKKYKGIDNIHFLGYMDSEKYKEYVSEEMDCGFVSLMSDYLGACVPSKIYEYINLELPMIGVLPNGDAKTILDKNRYGMTCGIHEVEKLDSIITSIKDENAIKKYRSNILKDKDRWSMEYLIQPVISILNKYIHI